VENEELHAQSLQEFIHKWFQEQRGAYEISVFKSGEEILDFSNKDFDLVFMDILLDGMDGVETAHKLRELGFAGQIVFLTSFAEYVFEGYSVHALNYLLKPVDYAKVAKCIEYVVKTLDSGLYTFRHRDCIYRIPYSEIICFSSDNHYTQIITTRGNYRQLEPLRNIYSYLPDQFHYCHRTAIVNIEHVIMLNGRDLLLSNRMTIPVSLSYLQNIRQVLLSCVNSMR